jgi:hypothetical protein
MDLPSLVQAKKVRNHSDILRARQAMCRNFGDVMNLSIEPAVSEASQSNGTCNVVQLPSFHWYPS